MGRCARCKFMYYCNGQCQIKDWKSAHKLHECQYYQSDISQFNSHLVNLDTPRLLLRLYCKLSSDPSLVYEKYKLYNGSERCFNDLMDHREDILIDQERMKIFDVICCVFKRLNVLFERDWLFKLYCKLFINGFAILNEIITEIGYGMYIPASIFDHSCTPNAISVFDGIKLEIRAMASIDTSLEPILITYLDITLPKDKRRSKLKRKYYFDCNCPACTQGLDIAENYHQLNIVFNESIQKKDWTRAQSVGLNIFSIYKDYLKTYHPETTIHLLQMMQIRRNLGSSVFNLNNSLTREMLSALNRHILVTHGKQHFVYKYEFLSLLKDLKPS